MLSVNKPLMQQAFSKMLQKNDIFYNAAYNAYYKNIEYANTNALKTLKEINSLFSQDNYFSENKEEWKKSSEVFADAFIQALKDGNFDKILADEIDKHVKSIELSITMMPQGIATIASPAGPCSGTMLINKSTANISVL